MSESDLVYVAASTATLVAAAFVWQRKGKVAGIATGVALFVAVVSLLVWLGYGY